VFNGHEFRGVNILWLSPMRYASWLIFIKGQCMCMSVKPPLGISVEGVFGGSLGLMIIWSAYGCKAVTSWVL
jgi:hypothetical protein